MDNFHLDKLDNKTIENIIFSIAILIGALVVIFILNRAIKLMARYLHMPVLSTRSVRNVIRYLTLIIAVCCILEVFNFKIYPILTVLGTILGLVAIGFVATWSILSNFLCTFVLIVFNPFAIGDEVEIPGDSVGGKVVDITLLFTTLRNSSGEYIHVPNNMFFQKIFKRRQGDQGVELSQQLREEKPAE